MNVFLFAPGLQLVKGSLLRRKFIDIDLGQDETRLAIRFNSLSSCFKAAKQLNKAATTVDPTF